MKIGQNKVVALEYELTVDGKVVDTATADKPLDYIHGTHMLLPLFETGVEGKEPGDSFEFSLQPADAYGDWDPKRKFDIPKDSFMIDGVIREDLLQVGRTLPMLNSSDQVVKGTIVEVKDDSVTMDFNHPMAGKVLNFKGKVVSVRDATKEELENGLHGEYLPDEECCHGEGGCCHHGDGECRHGEGECRHGEGECCHHGEGHCRHHGEEVPEDHRDMANE
jgi:FKBP-type peptidyl-prolyl cis-trans isomerase SlyD